MGIVLRQDNPGWDVIDDYYARAKREPTLRGDMEVTATFTYGRTFLDLVRALADRQPSHVVIATHGSANGLVMPLTSTTTISARTETLNLLLPLVEGLPIPDDAQLEAFAVTNNISNMEALELARVCGQVRRNSAASVVIHIRGCNIGANVANLTTIRQLFGARVVSGADCDMLYTPFEPDWHESPDLNINTWKHSHPTGPRRRREFVDPVAGLSRLVIDLEKSGAGGSWRGAIERFADLPRWADLIYNNTTHGVTGQMPLVAMWLGGSGYFLPHEAGYAAHIVASRN